MQYYIKGKYYSLDRREKSMGIILNIQLSAFINHRIEPNANNISNLMNELNLLKLKEFLPNITTGQTIDLVKGRVVVNLDASIRAMRSNVLTTINSVHTI